MASSKAKFKPHRPCEVRDGVYNVNVCNAEGCYGVICTSPKMEQINSPRRWWQFWRRQHAV